MPLVVICQQTTCQTGLPKGGSCDFSKGSKILKECGTLDSSKKKLETEALASLGSDIVDASNCIASLTWFLFASFEIVDKGKEKILIVVVGILILSIGPEIDSESCIAIACPFNNLLQRIDTILVPCDCLLARKMDLKMDDIVTNCMHLISHQAPEGLTLGNIAYIQIELDLILTLAKLYNSMVMALVDIFVDVLDVSDRVNALYVDMAPILSEQKDAEWNYIKIIDLLVIGQYVFSVLWQ